MHFIELSTSGLVIFNFEAPNLSPSASRPAQPLARIIACLAVHNEKRLLKMVVRLVDFA